jgi:hypothetical protein
MSEIIKTFPKHACQFCGCDRKYVETIIDDEFIWNEKEQMYQPNGFTDAFEHTGFAYCPECKEVWTGV